MVHALRPEVQHDKVDQQLYALALEQAAIHHFMFEEPDTRLSNTSLSAGGSSVGGVACVVYVAFKCREEDSVPNDAEQESAGTGPHSILASSSVSVIVEVPRRPNLTEGAVPTQTMFLSKQNEERSMVHSHGNQIDDFVTEHLSQSPQHQHIQELIYSTNRMTLD